MAEAQSPRTWRYAALFLAIACVLTFFRLMPLHDHVSGPTMTDPDAVSGLFGIPLRHWPGPDLMLALTLGWVVRRPDMLPAPVIAAYFLFEDLLLMRPPGLWALIVLIASEFLRARTATLRGLSFGIEYAVVTLVMLGAFLAYRAVLAVVMVPQAPLDLSLMVIIGTIAVYPLVVVMSHFVFKLRKPATGELDALGQRL